MNTETNGSDIFNDEMGSNSMKSIYFGRIHPILINILIFAGTLSLNHLIFWSIEQLHYRWCVSCGLYGFLSSILTNQSGVCVALRQLSNAASSTNHTLMYATTGLVATGLWNLNKTRETGS
jgi:hypothetical protein